MMEIYRIITEALVSFWESSDVMYDIGMAVSTVALTFIVSSVIYEFMVYSETEEFKSLVKK